MNKNIIIVIVGAFVIAMLVAVLVQAMVGGKRSDSANAAPTKAVLIAARDIPVGRELSEEDLKWKKWPETVIFPGAIIRDGEQAPLEAMSGKTVRKINEGEPVHMSAVVEEEGGFLTAKVANGMRAVGIEVRKHIIADRLITPGDAVDVIVTYRVRVNARQNPEVQSLVNRYASETILENVRVLAVDTDTSQTRGGDEKDKKSSKKKAGKKATVTLEVTPEGAEQLALAGEMGDISFAARGLAKTPEAQDDNMTTDVHMSRVLTDLSKLTSNGGGGTVRIYSGNSMEEVRGRNVSFNQNSGVDFSVEERPAEIPATLLSVPPQTLLQNME